MMLGAFALAYGGMSALSLGMNRHAREAVGRELTRFQVLALRMFGACALLLALMLAARGSGWALGIVEWTGLLTLSAMIVIVLHTYRAQSMLALSFWILVCAGSLALPA